MDINNSINLPNPFPRKTEEKYPFFPNKKILAKLKLNRNFKLNKLNISAHKETEKIREIQKSKSNNRKNYSLYVDRLNTDNLLKRKILIEGFNNKSALNDSNPLIENSKFSPYANYTSLLNDSNYRSNNSAIYNKSMNSQKKYSFFSLGGSNSEHNDKSLINNSSETIIDSRSLVKLKQYEWKKKLKSEKLNFNNMYKDIGLNIYGGEVNQKYLEFLSLLNTNPKTHLFSALEGNNFLLEDYKERQDKFEQDNIAENCFIGDLYSATTSIINEKSNFTKNIISDNVDIEYTQNNSLHNSSNNSKISTPKKVRPNKKLLLNKIRISGFCQKNHDHPDTSDKNLICQSTKGSLKYDPANSTTKNLPNLSTHFIMRKQSKETNVRRSSINKSFQNYAIDDKSKISISLSKKKMQNSGQNIHIINSNQDKIQILKEFNEKACNIQKFFRNFKKSSGKLNNITERNSDLNIKLYKLLSIWDKNHNNLFFISTPENSQEISELHFKIYSTYYKQAFIKNIKVREIYQLREKINKNDIINNPNIFLDLIEVVDGEIRIKNILSSTENKSVATASNIFSSPKKTKKGSNKVFTENYSLEVNNIDGYSDEANLNLFDANETLCRNNELYEDISITSVNTSSILADEDEDNFRVS